MNDEKIYKEIDFLDFEEKFKISINGCFVKGDSELDGNPLNQSKRMKKPENVSLLDSTRSRNIGNFFFIIIQIHNFNNFYFIFSNFP